MLRVMLLTAAVLAWAAAPAAAQQAPAPPAPAPAAPAAPADEHAGHVMPAEGEQADEHAAHQMVHFTSRDSSGTAWAPDFTPMYGIHRNRGAWEVMLHGNVFLQYLYESGEDDRTASQGGSINWVMGMARRPLGDGVLGLRGMFSLEPLTIGGCGYPVLLATGETCDGDTIHDKQHPHDLFMELAGEYDRQLSGPLRLNIYAGLAGEPALGPAGFPHRLSAFSNLLAPIGHHWLDATHITFGVVTAGVYGLSWKAEASAFNGREPDEDRFDVDLAPLDSYSGRLWLLPTDRIAVQLSAGRLAEAEAGHAGEPRRDVDRITASGSYHAPFRAAGYWATTVGWGVNREDHGTTHAFVVESLLTPDDRNNWFARVEIAGKDGEALHITEAHDEVFTVGRIQGGYARYFTPRAGLQPGIGVTLSGSIVPESLAPRYGGRVAPGVGVFLTLRPARM